MARPVQQSKKRLTSKEKKKKILESISNARTSRHQKATPNEPVVETTRKRKLNYKVETTDSESECSDSETNSADFSANYRIYHENIWPSVLKGLKCKNCSRPSLIAVHSRQQGFCCKLQIQCSECEFVNNECYTSPRNDDGKQNSDDNEKSGMEINQRITDAVVDMGAGYSGVCKLGAELNTPVMARSTFAIFLNQLHKTSVALCEKVLERSREIVRRHYQSTSDPHVIIDIIDITVSYDGSWHTRGHSSNVGLGLVIDVETGLVIDYIVLSKNCTMCNRMERQLTNKKAFAVWLKEHRSSGKCEKNFKGSSGSMEVYGAEILWKRSVAKCRMRYIVILSDGDCKSFTHLQNLQIYPGIEIQKRECMNHVGKRLYAHLKTVVDHCKANDITLGGARAGSLTDDKMKKMQGFFTSAIKKNAPDVEQMRRAILASLYHCSSTDESPNHDFCPAGATSWCFWQRALATETEPKSHSEMSLSLRQEVFEHILPVYEKLAGSNLLDRCTKIGTQNANESLHNSIWLKCPKNKAASLQKVEIATARAVSECNVGYEAVMKLLTEADSTSKTYSLKIARDRDGRSLNRSEARVHEESRYSRKEKKRKSDAQDRAKRKKEGISYGPGIAK